MYRVVLSLFVNSKFILVVPEAKPRDAYNISYHYFYSLNVAKHLVIYDRVDSRRDMSSLEISGL